MPDTSIPNDILPLSIGQRTQKLRTQIEWSTHNSIIIMHKHNAADTHQISLVLQEMVFLPMATLYRMIIFRMR